MSIKVYTQKPYVFHWDGTEYGLRLPTVDEMVKLMEARDRFFATITETQQQGDQGIATHFNFLVGKALTCDPADRNNPWFAENAEKQKELAQNNVHKNLAEEMPSAFFVCATEFFNHTIARANLSDEARATYDKNYAKSMSVLDDPAEGDSQAGDELPETPSEVGTETTPTPPNSVDSASESASTSNANLIQSTDGTTASS